MNASPERGAEGQGLRQRWRQWWWSRHTPRDTLRLGQRNIYILPSRPGLAYCATLLVILVASINDQLSLGYLLCFLLAGAGLASMHATHGNLSGLNLDLRTPGPGLAGQPLALELRLHNPGRARYGIGLNPASDRERAFTDVPAQGHASLQLRIQMPGRGLHELPLLRITTHFPLGLFGAWSLWRPAARAWVYPLPEAGAPPWPDNPGGQGLPGAHPGSGEPDGVRGYLRGDSPRMILWKKSALALARADEGEREPQLWVRERRSAQAQQLWLSLAQTAGADFEARLSRLAAWVERAEAQGRPYGLRLPGVEIPPALGPEQRRACMEALALAEEPRR